MTQASEPTPTPSPPPATILVVDDDEKVRSFIVRALMGAGSTVLEAPNGRTALTLLAKQPIDLLLTDLVMPDGEGIELIMAAHKAYPRLAIIAISGEGVLGPGQFLATARLLGAHRTLTKPFNAFALLAAVRETLAAPNAGADS